MSETTKEIDPRTSAEKAAFMMLCRAVKEWAPWLTNADEETTALLHEQVERFVKEGKELIAEADEYMRELAGIEHGYNVQFKEDSRIIHVEHGAFVTGQVWVALPGKVTK